MDIIFLLIAIAATFFLLKEKGYSSKLEQRLSRYNSLTSKEELENYIDASIKSKQDEINSLEEFLDNLKKTIEDTKIRLNSFEEEEYIQSFGFYSPIYEFDDSEKYKQKLSLIREEQKHMIKNHTAAICHMEWQVEGSRRKGKKMTNDFLRLVLMAFNGECDSVIPSVKYNNVSSIEKKINRAFARLNKLSETTHAEITESFLELKLQELRVFHEYQEKKQEEQEEQRRIRAKMKEEEKARREIERARKEAEREEEQYQKALEKARLEVEKATESKKATLMQKVQELEKQLSQAQINKEKAISRAKMSKSGHIYVVSNIGSFGNDIYRIGMTRREPKDSISDLGYAVPFPFDIHATIFCENAAEMEDLLHQHFAGRRVNKVNKRKEYFRVSLSEIKEATEEIARQTGTIKHEIQFTLKASAEEYHKSRVADNRNRYDA